MTRKTINESVLIHELVEVPDFHITEDVLGVPIKFTLDAIDIQITIPNTQNVKGPHFSKPFKAGTTTYPDGTKKNHYSVQAVEIRALWPAPIELPVTARSVYPCFEEGFTKRQISNVDDCLKKLQDIGNQALKNWLDMCRWVTGFERHGDIPRDYIAYLPDPKFRIAETDHIFWAFKIPPNRVYIVPPSISMGQWNEIEKRLSERISVPIWYYYIFEAQNKLFRRDIKGAILIAAIACETLIRHCISIDIEAVESDAVKDIIDNVNIRQIIGKFNNIDSLSGFTIDKRSINKLHKLFDIRNDVIHSASLTSSEQGDIVDIIGNARKFIDQVYAHIGPTQRKV